MIMALNQILLLTYLLKNNSLPQFVLPNYTIVATVMPYCLLSTMMDGQKLSYQFLLLTDN